MYQVDDKDGRKASCRQRVLARLLFKHRRIHLSTVCGSKGPVYRLSIEKLALACILILLLFLLRSEDNACSMTKLFYLGKTKMDMHV